MERDSWVAARILASYSSKASDGRPGGYNWSVPLRVAAGSEQVSFKNRLQGLHRRILYPDHSSYDSQAETIGQQAMRQGYTRKQGPAHEILTCRVMETVSP